MDLKNIVYPYNAMLFDNQKEWSTNTCHNMNLENMPSEGSQSQDHILYDTISMKCLEEANL